jgi:hypothetical protein
VTECKYYKNHRLTDRSEESQEAVSPLESIWATKLYLCLYLRYLLRGPARQGTPPDSAASEEIAEDPVSRYAATLQTSTSRPTISGSHIARRASRFCCSTLPNHRCSGTALIRDPSIYKWMQNLEVSLCWAKTPAVHNQENDPSRRPAQKSPHIRMSNQRWPLPGLELRNTSLALEP